VNPDVLVVGAGLAGCSVAWHLAPDHRVLVFDTAAEPGSEASRQNVGMLRRMGEDPFERTLARRTHTFLCDPGEDWEDLNPSRQTGAVFGLVGDPHQLHDAAAHLQTCDVPLESCPVPGEVAPAMSGGPYAHCWFLPEERVVDSPALLAGFLRGATRHGATFRLGTQVQSLIQEGERVVGVQTADGPVFADKVVLAAGAWCAVLAQSVGLNRPLIPLRRSVLRSESHALATAEHPYCWAEDEGLYLLPHEGSWLASPCDEAIAWPAAGSSSWEAPAEEASRWIKDRVEILFPTLARLSFAEGWSGLRTFAPDRRPVLGRDPALEGLWWAAGLGGFGVSCSYAVGEALAAWMREEDTPWLPAAAVSPGRPQASRWLIRPEGLPDRASLASASLPTQSRPKKRRAASGRPLEKPR
jgi:D-arginine dehydrogenase